MKDLIISKLSMTEGEAHMFVVYTMVALVRMIYVYYDAMLNIITIKYIPYHTKINHSSE